MLNCPTCTNALIVEVHEYSENRKIYSLRCPLDCYVPCLTNNRPNRNIMLELYKQLKEQTEDN